MGQMACQPHGRGTGFAEEVKDSQSASPVHSAPSFTPGLAPHTTPDTLLFGHLLCTQR